MGSEFYKEFDLVKKIFNQADERLNFPISKLILEGPENELQLTKNTQPAILTVSFSIFKVLKDEFNFDFKSFKYFAGHSLGEYSALVCSDSLNLNDALYLLYERGKAMQEAVPVGRGSMLAVLGMKNDEIKDLLISHDKKGVCEIANDNAEGQVILSGDKESVKFLKSILKEKKIKSIPLKVSAPFHCSLMKPAAKMEEKINSTIFNKPNFEIVNNVTATSEINYDVIKKLLIEQIYSSVKWRESIIYMSKSGVNNFVEIGPGKVLSGMVKRTLKDVNCFSINSITDIKNLKNEFKSKKILITGATGGIGNSLVEKFHNLGSTIIATGTNEEKLENLKKKFSDIYIEKFKLDEHDKIESFIDLSHKKLGGLDILVNNAGITLDNLSIRLSEENWKKVLDINLTSSFLMCKYAIKKMLKNKFGRIINNNFYSWTYWKSGASKLCRSKAGIIAFSKSLAIEYAKKNININCVSPGFIKTEMTDKINDEFKKNLINKIPSGNLGSAVDVSNCVAFLHQTWLTILMVKPYTLMVECIWLDNSN